jgi:hypothetical protein
MFLFFTVAYEPLFKHDGEFFLNEYILKTNVQGSICLKYLGFFFC